MDNGSKNERMSGYDRETTLHRNLRGTASSAPTSVKQEAVTCLVALSKTTRAGRGTATWTRDELHEH